MVDVDPKATEEMARLLAIMNGTTPPPQTSGGKKAPLTENSSNADAMKVILERFYSATDQAITSPDVAITPELHDAITTSRTPKGVQIGNWTIDVNVVNEKLKTYDVNNVRTGETIAKELLLYEAAHALVKLLNRGIAINTPRVREVLALEEAFMKHRNDAVQFRRKMRNRTLKESVLAVAEDRYAQARDQALRVRDHLRRLNEELG